MRANHTKAAPTDPADEAARRRVAAEDRADATLAELTELSEKARLGDGQAKARVFAILENNPELCKSIGDLSHRAEWSLLKETSGGNLAFQLALARCAAATRRELLTERTPPLV